MARSNNNLTAVLQDTANAIKAKKGDQTAICPRDFGDEIANLPSGPSLEDGLYNVDEGEATNLVNKIAASNANGEMVAVGTRYDNPNAGTAVYSADGSSINCFSVDIQPGIAGGYAWTSSQGKLHRGDVYAGHCYRAICNPGTGLFEDIGPITGTKTITSNGIYNITNFEAVEVSVSEPQGEIWVYENFPYDGINVKNYALVKPKIKYLTEGSTDDGWVTQFNLDIVEDFLQHSRIIGAFDRNYSPFAPHVQYYYHYNRDQRNYSIGISSSYTTKEALQDPLCVIDFRGTNDTAHVLFAQSRALYGREGTPIYELWAVLFLATYGQNVSASMTKSNNHIRVDNFGGTEADFVSWLQNKYIKLYDLFGHMIGTIAFSDLYEEGNPDPFYSTFFGLPWQNTGSSSNNNGEYSY